MNDCAAQRSRLPLIVCFHSVPMWIYHHYPQDVLKQRRTVQHYPNYLIVPFANKWSIRDHRTVHTTCGIGVAESRPYGSVPCVQEQHPTCYRYHALLEDTTAVLRVPYNATVCTCQCTTCRAWYVFYFMGWRFFGCMCINIVCRLCFGPHERIGEMAVASAYLVRLKGTRWQ